MRNLSSFVALLCASLSVLLFAASPEAFAQEGHWCSTPDTGPAAPVPSGFRPDTLITGTPIPVIFHLVWKKDPLSPGVEVGNIPSSQIETQVDVLNEEFADTGLSFSLLGIARIENEQWYDQMDDRWLSEISSTLNVDPRHVMNVYVGDAQDGVYGGALLAPPHIVGTPQDGFWLSNFYIGTSFAKNTVHETGHYLDLRHTWGTTFPGGASCEEDDGILDTGRQEIVFLTCPTDPMHDTCDNDLGYPDPVFNHMNYTSISCRTEFSPGQRQKILEIRDGIRRELGQNVPTVIDERSGPVTYTNPTFSGEAIYILPTADVTVTGVVTLLNGAQFVTAGGTDLSGVTDVVIEGESVFDIRRSEQPLALSGNLTVSGHSRLLLGQQVVFVPPSPDEHVTNDASHLDPPSLLVAGDITVSDSSAVVVGNGGRLALGVGTTARFDGGSRYSTWGQTTLGASARLVFEPSAAAPQFTTFADTTFALGAGAQLVFRNGGYTLAPVTVHRLDPAEAWDQVAFEGDSLTLRNAFIGGGTTGALVRARGIVFDNVTFSGNARGIVTDYDPCEQEGPCSPVRSHLTLSNSAITGSVADPQANALTGHGLVLRNTDAEVTGTTISGNDGYGVVVWNADVWPFTGNTVSGNGFPTAGNPASKDGILIHANGDLRMSQVFASGLNTVSGNSRDQLRALSGSYLLVGTHSNVAHLPANNKITAGPDGGTTLIRNNSGSPVPAQKTWWGDLTGPPPGSFAGADTVYAEPFLEVPPFGASPPDESALAGRTASPLEIRRGEVDLDLLLGDLLALRDSLSQTPDDPEAPGWTRELYLLQRLDHDDALGQYAETMALITALRQNLDLPDPADALRHTAEAALGAEVSEALLREDYDLAEALLAAYGDGSVEEGRLSLLLSAVALHEQGSRYADALVLVGEATLLVPEDEAAELELIAALIEERRAEETEASSGIAGKAAGTAPTSASGTVALPVEVALHPAYPNPTAGGATVPFDLPAAAEVRVAVYDLLGRTVAVLAEGLHEAGRHEARFGTARLASGVYVIRAEVAPTGRAAQVFTQKLTLLR